MFLFSRLPSRLRFTVSGVLFAVFLPFCASATPLWKTPSYTQAIIQARAGNSTLALSMLESARKPLPAPLLNDYLTLLCWQQRCAQALRLSVGHENQLWPDTLRLLARGARDARNFASALRLYRALMASSATASASDRAALAMTLAENRQSADALPLLDAASVQGEDDLRELTRARAYVLLLSGDYARALDYTADALQRFPGDGELMQRQRDVQVRLGLAPAANISPLPLSRMPGLGQSDGRPAAALLVGTIKPLITPAAYFNDYLLELCRQGQLDQAVSLAQGQPGLLTHRTLLQLRSLALARGDRSALQKLDDWQHSSAATARTDPLLFSADGPLREARERADLLIRQRAYSQALAWLAQWRPLYAADPVLNDRYLTVLQALGLVAQQQSVIPAPMPAGRKADWEYAQQRAGELAVWGAIDADQLKGVARYAATDQALALNAPWLSASGLRPEMRQQTLDLRMQLLAQRDAAAAVAFYRNHPDLAWSAASSAALAGALLTMHAPLEAERWYRTALRLQPQADDALNWQLGLAYALLESGQYRAARRHLVSMQAATPRQKPDPLERRPVFNPDFQAVMAQQAMFMAWMSDPLAGQRQLEALLDNSPYATDLRQGLANIALLRGWPRLAGSMFRRLQVDQAPDSDANTSLGLVDVALETQSFDRANSMLTQLEQDLPGVPSVRERRQRWQALTGPELTVQAGHDLGGVQGSNERNAWDSQTRLYGPASGSWRVFAEHLLQTADFTSVDPAQQGRYETLGVGGQYRSPWAHGEFGVVGEVEGRGRQGGFAGIDWTPDDHWTLGTRYEQNSAQLPLIARLDDIGGNLLQGSVQYRYSDALSMSLTVSQLNMSDGNRRQSASVGVDQRLIAGPGYQLSLETQVEASRNDVIDNARYFNPSKDLGLSVTAMNDWTLWRAYERSWHQRAGLTVGRYQQQGFGSDQLWSLKLEQVLDWSQRFSVTYGLTRTAHPYDGSTSIGNRVYLNLDWRF